MVLSERTRRLEFIIMIVQKELGEPVARGYISNLVVVWIIWVSSDRPGSLNMSEL